MATATIVIDPGHGGRGSTGGSDGNHAVSATGVKEKDLALQICQKIQQLAPQYNVNVVMTRSDDNLPGGGTTIS